jgi:hypothetical protein
LAVMHLRPSFPPLIDGGEKKSIIALILYRNRVM